MERAEAEAILDGDRETALALLMRIDELIEANRRLEARVAELEQRLNRSSRNSSLPPSADPPSAPPRPRRPGSGRERGAQPGHKGRSRPLLALECVDELIDALERKQGTASTLVAGLGAPLSARAWPARSRRCRGRIGRGRQRGVARASVETLFELCDAGLQPSVRLDQLIDSHQQGERRLPVAVEYRLRLGTFHTARVRRTQEGPCSPNGQGDLNAYQNLGSCSTIAHRALRAMTPSAGFPNLVSLVRFQPGAPLLACTGRFRKAGRRPSSSPIAVGADNCRRARDYTRTQSVLATDRRRDYVSLC